MPVSAENSAAEGKKAGAVKVQQDAVPRPVRITSLEMWQQTEISVSALPPNARIERAVHATPELARWLYGAVGGPWRWYERLGWSYEQWAQELADVGSEIWLLSLDGTPAGYCQLAAAVHTDKAEPLTQVEILYFGLMTWAQGRGLGRVFLEQMISQAWRLDTRHALPAVERVWVHTCDLDGPYALANYQRRGFEVCGVETEEELILPQPLGSWEAQFAR